MSASSRYVLLGAHLLREDAEIEGVTVLPAGGIFLSAIDAPPRSNVAERDLIAKAARARQELAAKETFIAIRYGATASSPEEAAVKCAVHLDRWKSLLERRRGMAELTLKAGSTSRPTRPDRASFTSGAAYLRALREASRGAEADPAFMVAARERLGEIAERVELRRREEGGSELAILIRRSAVSAARNAAEELRKLFPAVPFLLSGPWPLEVFADDE
ncbi:MAG TPA: GvpL/GvpF family gas vesicle protein [Thermoanaerobaculia bacterium]|nr:GvpL/GvpF family gas vesicle protein [Thermoanaerobaculia bacterium]